MSLHLPDGVAPQPQGVPLLALRSAALAAAVQLHEGDLRYLGEGPDNDQRQAETLDRVLRTADYLCGYLADEERTARLLGLA